jgi:THO complex subunit 4
MSGKLDQSLDDILSTRRRSAGPRRRSQRQTPGNGRPTATAPVGGVQKTSKNARTAANKPAASKATPHTGDSKIIVSNLVRLSAGSRHPVRRHSLRLTPLSSPRM